jgi:xanthine/uracil permease
VRLREPGGETDRPAQVHPVDEVLPPQRLAVLGLQHLCITYAGAVAVPLIAGGALKLSSTSIGLPVSAVSLSAGLIPAVAPSFHGRFPSDFQVIFGSSITSTVIVVFVLNLVFNHWTWRRPQEDDAIDEALRFGAVSDGQQPG